MIAVVLRMPATTGYGMNLTIAPTRNAPNSTWTPPLIRTALKASAFRTTS